MKKRIAIHSVPRSGSNWLGAIIDSNPHVIFKHQPLFSYAFKDYLDEHASTEDIHLFFEKIAVTKDEFLDRSVKKHKEIVPVFTKQSPTTIVYKEVRYHHLLQNMLRQDKALKVIGLIRNPCGVINSWLKAPREFKKELGWKAEEEWRYAPKKNCGKPEEFNGFEKWKEVAYLFQDLKSQYPDRFFLITYHDLLNRTNKSVQKIFDFCNLKMADQTIEFIKTSRNKRGKDTYGVYRTKKTDNQWISELPQHIQETIQEILKGTSLEKYLRY